MMRAPEKYRMLAYSKPEDGNNGLFLIPMKRGQLVRVIASDGEGWEHVSVSRLDRPPTWDEMCAVKKLFWEDEDCVVQYHPPESEYVNNHPNCLHLWRPMDVQLPRPASTLVGVQGIEFGVARGRLGVKRGA